MRLAIVLWIVLWIYSSPIDAVPCDTIKDIQSDTAVALAQIHANQHPTDCKTAHYLLCAHARGGVGNFGSKLVALASCLGRALERKAVAVQATGAMGVGNLVDQLAPFMPWSNCSVEDARAVQARHPNRVVTADFITFPEAPEDSVHGVRKMSYESLPKQWRKRGKVWWKAVELAYMLRPTPETQAVLDAFKTQVGWTPAHAVHAMHIRRGDKIGTESHYYPFMFFIEAMARMTDAPTPTSPPQDIFIATDDRPTVHMETEPYSGIRPLFFPQQLLDTYKGPAPPGNLAVAVDILLLAQGQSLTFTASSNFGIVALYLNLIRQSFCMNFTTLDLWHPFWWGDDVLLRGNAVEVYHPVVNVQTTTQPLAWSHITLWRGTSNQYIRGGRGSYRPSIGVEFDSSVFNQANYLQDSATFLCKCW